MFVDEGSVFFRIDNIHGYSLFIQLFRSRGQRYIGKITARNPAIDEHGMISVTAEVGNNSGSLIDGMRPLQN